MSEFGAVVHLRRRRLLPAFSREENSQNKDEENRKRAIHQTLGELGSIGAFVIEAFNLGV